MRCVVYSGVGGREVVSIEERPDPRPGRYEVLIAPRFAGLNPADVLQREGRHPVPPGAPTDVPGLEVAGEVVAVGDGASGFAVGDRAFGLVGGGGLASLVVAHERELARVPDSLDDRAAAAVPEAFLTAFDAIVLQAGLVAGDTLLVNGGSGGVGTAAIQIAHAMGARVIAGVRNEAVHDRIRALGATVLLPDAAIAHAREVGGADVVLELVGAVHVNASIAALARRGRLVIVAAKPGDTVQPRAARADGAPRAADRDDAETRPLEEKGVLVQAFARRVVPLLADGTLAPLVDRTFALDDAADALDAIREPGKLGKLLLAVGPDAA